MDSLAKISRRSGTSGRRAGAEEQNWVARSVRACALAGLLAIGLPSLVSAADSPEAGPNSPPKPRRYPHVTLSVWFEVDAEWPQRPKDIPWGQTPGVAVDGQDQVWVFTRANPPVQVYTAAGRFVRAWGEEVFGPAAKTLVAHHIRIDNRNRVWLADVGNHVIWQLSPEGKVLQTLGTSGVLGCDETHLNKPTDMAIAPNGDVFVADGYGNARVVQFNAAGKFVKTWGKLGSAPGEFSIPHAIVMDSQGRLYVADRNNARVQVFDREGQLLNEWKNVVVPWGLWITPQDEIWVCGNSPMAWRDTDDCLSCPPKDQLFMKFDTTGKAQNLWTVPKGTDGAEKPGELNWVHGLAQDSQGNLYATDIMGKRAQKFVRH